MIPVLNTSSDAPLYDQLYRYYRDSIHERKLKKGERMPSVRKLAYELHISNNTVVKCYEQLTDEGYLVNIPRKGLYVAALEKLEQNISINILPAVLPKLKASKIKYNLGRSVVDEYRFPMREWRRSLQLSLDHLSFQYVQYDFFNETSGLKEQLANYLYRTRGVVADAEQIVIAAGCNSLFTLLSILLKTDYNKIIFEEPGFEHARNIFELFGYTINPIEVTKNGIDINKISKEKQSLVFLTPCHQYPTGVVMSTANRVKLLNWAGRTNSYIIEDDYDSIFRHRNKPIPPLYNLDNNGSVIYIGTISKLFIPSLRVAYMVLPKSLLAKFSSLNYLAYSVPYQTQKALALFMEKGHLERHVRRMQKNYKEKFHFIQQQLKKIFGKKITILEQEAGLSVLIEVKTKMSEDKLIELARQNGIALRGAAVTYYRKENIPPYPGIFIGFGNLSLKQVPVVLNQLKNCWFEK